MEELHEVAERDAWLTARRELLAREKSFTRERDALSAARRALPWLPVRERYEFDGPDGRVDLPALFGPHSQLVVYHFMYAPEWSAGCAHCSFWADNFAPNVVHLAQRGVAFAAVSRAPLAQLATYQRRMQWTFPWYSSGASRFNYDFNVSFTEEQRQSGRTLYNFGEGDPGMTDREGVSVFFKDEAGQIFLTYATHARGLDLLNTAYNYLDLVPRGRDEGDRGPFWVRRHDEYEK